MYRAELLAGVPRSVCFAWADKNGVMDNTFRDLAQTIDRTCRLHREFLLRSGSIADEYFDKYLFESDPALLRRVVDQMVPLIPADTDVLGGLELGGVPLVTVLSQVTGLPSVVPTLKCGSHLGGSIALWQQLSRGANTHAAWMRLSRWSEGSGSR